MTRARSVWVLTVLCAAVGLVVAAVTTLYAASADVARAVGASQSELTWIIDVYTLAMAGMLLPAGALGDRYGRKRILVIGTALFAVLAIALCFVESPTALIALRLLSGLAAALVLPSTLSLITSTFPADFRDTAVGIWTASFTLAGGIAILITGVLLEFFSWHCAFWSVAFGAVIVFAASLTMPTSREEHPPPIDVPGAIAAAVSISSLVYALIQAGLDGWGSPNIIVALAVAVLSGAWFAVTQLRSPNPLLDVRLFKIRAFAVSTFTVVAAFASVYGIFFLLMQFQQFVLGYSALKAGAAVSSMAIPIVPISLASPWLTARFGLRVVVAAGCVLASLSFALMLRLDADSSYLFILAVLFPMGAGVGMNMTPCTNAIISSVPKEKQGVGASVNHTTREVGTAIGVALLGGLLAATYPDHVERATQTLPGPAQEASRASVAGALEVASASGGASGAALADTARDAFVTATHSASMVMLALMLGVAVIAAFWAPSRSAERDTAKATEPEPTEPLTAAEVAAGNGGPQEGPDRSRLPLGPVRPAVSLARFGAVASWRTASWTAGTTTKVGARVVRAAASGDAPDQLLRSVGHEARHHARRALGLASRAGRNGDG